MKPLFAALFVLSVVGPALAQDVAEPKSGAKFAVKDGDTSLLGVGLRTKTMLKVKVYAIGLYVADSAISGPLKGKAGTPALYGELLNGDFKKKVVMKFVRNVSADQVREAFHDALKGVGGKTDEWIAYFGDIRSGQECVIAWTPGVGLETKVVGVDKQAINDKAFASAVFGIWLGDKPIQEDIKKDLVARAAELLK
ncbi:MAG TPA: chalcone isomerase family protein [Candidatus Sulfotelmatobacter sp.]|nr:chalcone isomerase family protein [Candidatus Sulfotelmatobacter sp.]